VKTNPNDSSTARNSLGSIFDADLIILASKLGDSALMVNDPSFAWLFDKSYFLAQSQPMSAMLAAPVNIESPTGESITR
jgi:hypothetical protein